MTYTEQQNSIIRDRQINLQNEIDLLETGVLPDHKERVYDDKAIENVFLLRLDDESPQECPMELKINKRTGWTSPKHRWTAEIVDQLTTSIKTMSLDDLENNDFGFTRKAIVSKLIKLGYKMDRSSGRYIKK